MKDRIQQVCKQCGKVELKLPSQLLTYCSPQCHHESRRGKPSAAINPAQYLPKNKGTSVLDSHKGELAALYNSGWHTRQLAEHFNVSRGVVRVALNQTGAYQRGRPRRKPGFKPNIRLTKMLWKPDSHIMRQYRSETMKCRQSDEDNHWGNHPLIQAWWAPRIKHRRQRAGRTNYYFTKILRSRIYCVLKGYKKSAPTLTLLGCTLESFKAHLESKFTHRMTWNNYGGYWHIDHIIPCSAFDLSKHEDQRRCFHYSNMQPLRAIDNWSKHDTIQPTQPHLLI